MGLNTSKGDYVTKEDIDDASEMLGAGYEIHPATTVLEMRTDYSLEKRESIAWVKIDVGFRGIMKKLKGSQLSVFLAISLRINNQGLCYPSFETIAEDTGYSLRAVKTAAKKLQGTGFLTIIKGKTASNMYHVNAFAAFGESDPDSAKIALGANIDREECKNEHKNMSEIALKEEPIKENQEVNWKKHKKESIRRKKEHDKNKKDPVTEILKAHRGNEPILQMRKRVEAALRGRKPDWDAPRSLWNGYDKKLIQREKDTGETIEAWAEWYYGDDFRSNGDIYLKPNKIDDWWSKAFTKNKQEQVEYYKPKKGNYVPNPNP